jgi:hypothetical protein
VVERELRRDAVVARRRAAFEPVEQRVDVVALREHAVVGVQPLHLAQAPVEVVVVAAVEHPVHREVRTDAVRSEQVRSCSGAEILQGARRHPAPAREQPRPDHAAGVEVVALVPAVVGDLVSLVGLHEGEQHGAELDLATKIVGRGTVGVRHFVIPNRSRPKAVIALPRTSL